MKIVHIKLAFRWRKSIYRDFFSSNIPKYCARIMTENQVFSFSGEGSSKNNAQF
jgi:hypothetical protein